MADYKEAIEVIEKKLGEHREKLTQESKEAVTKLQGELISLKDKEVKELNEKVATMGGTLKDVMEEVKELKAKRSRFGDGSNGGRRETVVSKVSDMIAEKKDLFIQSAQTGEKFNKGEAIEVKAPGVVTTSSLSGGSYLNYLDWRLGMEPTGQTRIRDFVQTFPSAFDQVIYPQANKPVGQGSFGRQVNEGDTKAQVDRGYTMQNLTLKSIAGWITVSRQSLRNIPFLQTWLPTSLNEQILDQEDVEFSAALIAAATGNNSMTGAAAVAAEQLIMLVKNGYKAKFKPGNIAIDPDKWASLLITKPQNYSMPLGYAVDANGTVRCLGIPVLPVNWLTGGRAIVADWSRVAIIESEGLNFRQTDSHASTFTANEITFLLERVDGIAAFRPDAIITNILS